jgi:hypothetical protein
MPNNQPSTAHPDVRLHNWYNYESLPVKIRTTIADAMNPGSYDEQSISTRPKGTHDTAALPDAAHHLAIAFRLWAKTDRGSDKWHALPYHLIDVGSAASALWDRLPEPTKRPAMDALGGPDTAKRVALFLAASHDIGKANRFFQSKSPSRLRALGLPSCFRNQGAPADDATPATLVSRSKIFKFGEAKDQGGHLKIAGNAVEFEDPALLQALRALFEVDEQVLIGQIMEPKDAIDRIDPAIRDLASSSVDQTVLEALPAMRGCALRADPLCEFGMSLI